ncbi:acetyl-CoA carboxylase biotin carboxyl carrier protein [Clostridium sp. MD294]|uniref:acetyl-CoA carboxylase biotin carboxyl carrier protein n=1 Tax=Clostridium sp. MD294 TaxID=97138 RepID=UPI0002CB467C|nr:acetyl-CoA carboxylase biotin carboxyl carrier protein [Clostridium sp. MD294]NDO45697.1 acetyl-CoA carboxylase biotin carboxyl carrier protein [Clostridium sp. MD294]USF30650.1 Biotin carboxyl carrier protein of acetyl-CoA carboxylase [Clostridium sp. MD294]
MTYAEVKELISIINSSALTNFELNMDNVSVKMSKNKETVTSQITTQHTVSNSNVETSPIQMQTTEITIPTTPETIVELSGNIVKSPIVGTFYAAPGSDKPSFVKVGDKVQEGDILCIVEAMKIMNEITSPYIGEIAEIYVSNEELVEYGQPLFRIK